MFLLLTSDISSLMHNRTSNFRFDVITPPPIHLPSLHSRAHIPSLTLQTPFYAKLMHLCSRDIRSPCTSPLRRGHIFNTKQVYNSIYYGATDSLCWAFVMCAVTTLCLSSRPNAMFEKFVILVLAVDIDY